MRKINSIGRHFGRYDLDRTGFFDDSPPGPFDEYKTKKPQERLGIFPSGPKNEYFEKGLKRIFTGEALTQIRRKEEKQKVLKNVITPSSPAKFHSTPGDWHGCFGKQPERFSPEVSTNKGKRTAPSLPNFKIKPNPLGGPGYVDICFNPYPKYLHEEYDVKQKDRQSIIEHIR